MKYHKVPEGYKVYEKLAHGGYIVEDDNFNLFYFTPGRKAHLLRVICWDLYITATRKDWRKFYVDSVPCVDCLGWTRANKESRVWVYSVENCRHS